MHFSKIVVLRIELAEQMSDAARSTKLARRAIYMKTLHYSVVLLSSPYVGCLTVCNSSIYLTSNSELLLCPRNLILHPT